MRALRNRFSLIVLASTVAWMGCSSNPEDGLSTPAKGGESGTNRGTGGSVEQSGGTAAKSGSSSGVSTGGSVAANSSSSSSPAADGGSSAYGGAPATGGSNSTGGRTASGGSSSAKGGSSTLVGGAQGNGGTPGNGGVPSVGGKASGGAAVGGTVNSGGRTGNAGSPSKGGAANGGATSGGTAGTTSSGAGAGKTHLFLLLGQSNMAGYPKAQDSDKVKNTRITVLGFDDCAATGRKKDKWDTAVPPLHECSAGAIGPGDWFSKTLIESLPAGDTIGLIPCAYSGEKIETFLKAGGSHYATIVARAKLAMQTGGVIEGMLFHQGESNCGDPAWPGNVKQMVTDLKTDLGFGDIPFLAGEFSSGSKCTSQNALISQLPGLISNAVVIPGKDLKIDPADTQWTLHFDHDSQVTFGKRYAEAMKIALKW